ncbi:hypothetical protein [Actinomadura sp. 7K534]|uniref:hypothetical protein n=1 Tax=Actinomadura sp. 7K534 TaxID=2530366 RepID=UPI0014051059|nr:hypothetical protein [Actinomadura sp. 7K534]
MSRTDTTKPTKPEETGTADSEPAEATAAAETSSEEKAVDDKPAKEVAEAKDEPAKDEAVSKEGASKDEPDEPDEPAEEKKPLKVKGVKKESGEAGAAVAGKRAWARMPGKAGLVRATVAVALVGSVVTAGLQWYQADQAAQRDAERREVRSSAAEFGEALLSYDHTKLQAARDRVLGLASDDFAKTYDEAFTGGLEGVITKLKASATATVRTVYLEEIEAGTAKAVVVMDSEVTSTAGTRRVLGSYLDMRLTRRGDEWKVTEVTSVGAANETMTNPDGEQQKPDAGVPSPDPSP